MKLAIMQPYFFPYIGYFQLLNAVDRFILYDDVQFIKEGWIHRNRLLVNKQSTQFTLPLKKDSHTAKINERLIAGDRWDKERGKVLKMIRQSYGKAPCFKTTFRLVEDCLTQPTDDLVTFIEYSLKRCCKHLGISTKIERSSSLCFEKSLGGQQRVLAICETMQADKYINAIGGRKLYERESFLKKGIALSFIQTKDIHYAQFNNEFVPWLSIIDVMMFNPVEKIWKYLDMYELVEN